MSRQFDPVLRGILIAVGSALLIAAGSAAWSMKESVQAHQDDFQKLDTKVERVLDVVCLDRKPKPRECS